MNWKAISDWQAVGSDAKNGRLIFLIHACGCLLDLRPDMAILSVRASIQELSDFALPQAGSIRIARGTTGHGSVPPVAHYRCKDYFVAG